jgi:hypothetical protein
MGMQIDCVLLACMREFLVGELVAHENQLIAIHARLKFAKIEYDRADAHLNKLCIRRCMMQRNQAIHTCADARKDIQNIEKLMKFQ